MRFQLAKFWTYGVPEASGCPGQVRVTGGAGAAPWAAKVPQLGQGDFPDALRHPRLSGQVHAPPVKRSLRAAERFHGPL